MYTEASLGSFHDETKLYTPVYQPIEKIYCLKFSYHVYGNHIGKLLVKLDCQKKTNITLRVTENIGNEWKTFIGNVGHEVNDKCRFVFAVLRGHGIRGDISIDQVSLFPGACPKERKISLICDFTDKHLCGYEPKPGLLTWNSHHDFETGLEKLSVNTNLAWPTLGLRAVLLFPNFNLKSNQSCLRITYILEGGAYLKLNDIQKHTLWKVKGDKGSVINYGYIDIRENQKRLELEAGLFGKVKRIELIESSLYVKKNCKKINKICPKNYWHCSKHHECIPKNQLCDSILNCFDKSDEYECSNRKYCCFTYSNHRNIH